MAITVQTNTATLTWANFLVVPNQIVDPADNTLVDAYTTFNWGITPDPPNTQTINGQTAFADPMTITITPNAKVWSGVAQTAALLSHEQWHYDIGTATARSLARQIAALRGSDFNDLIAKLRAALNLHFTTRAGILQKRYDLDTRHGTNAHYQRVWKDRMTACLSNASSDQIGGFYL
jgi:hypothetical protein